ncbi:YcnI family protein [Nocardia sp. NPDC046763]|uniref:YcnI family copper-binding membrane protein n=1 Tax=Nocardia sp. NPDC046763 TaxID=3155256 RepID=UPI003409CC40
MNNSWIYRAGFTGIAAAAAVVIAAAPAGAHVSVSGPDAARGGSAVLTFRVPNESATGSPTTALTVQFPALTEVNTQTMPGWRAEVSRNADHKVTGVTWTADPGGGIGPRQFGSFAVLADGLPDTDSITMPATQTYADGQTVKWDQTSSGGSEPENPAPVLQLAPKPSGAAADHGDVKTAAPQSQSEKDTTARWLGSIGIVLGALGLLGGLGLGVARRKS